MRAAATADVACAGEHQKMLFVLQRKIFPQRRENLKKLLPMQ